MSTFNIGQDDVPKEFLVLKERLSSKDTQCADLESKLSKRDAELNDLILTLNETARKLSSETVRADKFEEDFSRCIEDLKNVRANERNLEDALFTAQDKIKATELYSRELQATINTLSHQSDSSDQSKLKLERENAKLQARIRELEVNFKHPPIPPPAVHRPGRPRSSSVSHPRSTELQRELDELKSCLLQKDFDLRNAQSKLASLQSDLVCLENEKAASEKQCQSQVDELKSRLEQQDDELQYLRAGTGSAGGSAREREEELLERIEEDCAKITTLEKLLAGSQDVGRLRDALHEVERQLTIEVARAEHSEVRLSEVVREKEEALGEVYQMREKIEDLDRLVEEKERMFSSANERAEKLEIEMKQATSFSERQGTSVHDETVCASHIERLLAAIARLRSERDALRRDLHFLQLEHRFATESRPTEDIAHLPHPLSEHESLCDSSGQFIPGSSGEHEPSQQLKKAVQAATACAIVSSYWYTQWQAAVADGVQTSANLLTAQDELRRAQISACNQQTAFLDLSATYHAVEARLSVALSELQQAELQIQNLTAKTSSLVAAVSTAQEDTNKLEVVKLAHQETQDALAEANAQVLVLTRALNEAESERDSLKLEVTNLQSDLTAAKEDLIAAESRYTVLQMHQLSAMSENEMAASLREQIEELEARVLRRTEQIGVHQHDIKRLETNLRLQEERVVEMTAELEMATSQKEAMVEDCADARESRDEAVARVEKLEMEIEGLEIHAEKLDHDRNTELEELVHLLVQAISNTKNVREEVAKRTSERDALDAQRLEALEEMHRRGQEIVRVHSLHDSTQAALEDRTSMLQSLQRYALSAESDMRQVILALAITRADATKKAELVRTERASRDDLSRRLVQMEELLDSKDIEQQMESQRIRHQEQIKALKVELDHTQRELQSCEVRLTDAQALHDRLSQESNLSEGNLRKELDGVQARLHDAEAESNRLQVQYEEQLESLQSEVRIATATLATEQQLRAAMDIDYCQLTRDHEKAQQEYKDLIAESGDRLQSVTQRFESQMADLIQKNAATIGGLEADHEHAVQENKKLKTNLEEELEDHARKIDAQKQELEMYMDRCQRSAVVEAELRQKLENAQEQLVRSRLEFESIQLEKVSLQEETTNLEAQIQKSISLTRFLESKTVESEKTIASLHDDLLRLRETVAKSEKAARVAEVNLNLQAADHDRALNGVLKEVESLRAKPDQAGLVAELRQQIQDMEELLRSKCAEIEENDDRFIEMLKEKKKLTAKVNAYSRKITSLQNKLASKGSPSTVITPPGTTAPPKAQHIDDIPMVPPVPAHVGAAYSARSPMVRAVSGPSSLPRPKTPESKSNPAVFKARTPERRAVSTGARDAAEVPVSAGKKRRLPDDWDEQEKPDTQAIMSGSENKTPRLRKILHNVQSGFTPTRNSAMRSAASQRSPARKTSTALPLTADLSNNPRVTPQSEESSAARTSKQSWLGKIRGNGAFPQMSSRPLSSASRHPHPYEGRDRIL